MHQATASVVPNAKMPVQIAATLSAAENTPQRKSIRVALAAWKIEPEVAGEGAILVDPTDPKAIADALLRLETDAAFRARQVAYGLERVKRFSWEKTARHLLALYESLGKTN